MGSSGLGINKDLEPLVRRVRREGGTVEVTAATHVRWTLPDGSVLTSGLTMNSRSARRAQRDIEDALDRCSSQGRKALERQFTVTPDGRGKYLVVDGHTGEPLRNANGFPRTFSTHGAASAAHRAHVVALLRQS